MNLGLDYVPTWAYSWCYFFALVGVLSLIRGVVALCLIRTLGVLVTTVAVMDALVQAATSFTLFWMCRSSLRGQRNLVI
jgi:hypothetical protein